MASVKVKFRPSTQAGKEGTIYYQVIHKRVIRQLKTDYHILVHEWDEKNGIIIGKTVERTHFLCSVKERIKMDVRRLSSIISRLESENRNFTANDIIERFHASINEQSFFQFMNSVITQLKRLNKERTAETYTAALNSFASFRKDKDVLLDEIDSNLMMEYEMYLKAKGVTMNTVSFYMRILRAVYNRAVEKELISQHNPFKHVYTGVDKTIKRAIPLKVIKQIKNLDLSMKPSLDFARDMFLFSFYTRGMSFIDMAYLKKKDLQNGILSYRRRKTGQQIFIRWEKCMQEIIDKYPETGTNYLLSIIKTTGNERLQYRNALRLINNKLKGIATMTELHTNLTMYVARHSWASIARNQNIPISVISEGMGHNSETTTQVYLASLDSSIIDKANEMILKNL